MYERTRELGLVRAVGATRPPDTSLPCDGSPSSRRSSAPSQGIIIGILLGYAVILALHSQGLRSFTIPVVSLIIILVIAFAIGVVAAIRPARRAAKLDVLRAVTTE